MYNAREKEEREKTVHLRLRGMKNIFQSTTTQRFYAKTKHNVEAETKIQVTEINSNYETNGKKRNTCYIRHSLFIFIFIVMIFSLSLHLGGNMKSVLRGGR